MRKLLVISSKPLGEEITRELRRTDWDLEQTASAIQARRRLSRMKFLVALAVFWPEDDDDHRTRLGEIISDHPGIRWVAAIPRGAVQHESCAALIATRVYDYFSLPIDPARLSVVLGHAYGMTEVGIRFLQRQSASTGRFGMIGRSAPMLDLFRDIEWAAKSDAPVLLVGETGTGKEHAAHAIHANSARREGPFVPVSCGTTPTAVIEQTLFGHAESAGARLPQRLIPTLEPADGGTLFLDDIAEMPLPAQALLLRYLTERERLLPGEASSASGALDIRIIAASPRDLDEDIQEGHIFSDLFYRLAVIVIHTPPLRERTEDLELLAQHFLTEAAKSTPTKALGLSRAALVAMKHYDWPGNLLELSNHVLRGMLFSRGPHLTARDLDLPRYAAEGEPLSLEESRDRAEKESLRRALARNRRNVTRAAKELQISRMTLYRLLEKHGMARQG